MTNDAIANLFPITVRVGKKILRKGTRDLYNVRKCIGARALRKALKGSGVEIDDIVWASDTGRLFTDSGIFHLGCNTPLMDLTEPKVVTFRLRVVEERK